MAVRPWPVHVEPAADELLSSWMIRFAHANGLVGESFVTAAFGYRFPLWNRDIDRSAPDVVLEKLAELSCVSVERLQRCTLRDYEELLSPSRLPSGACAGVLPLGVFHRTRKRHGLMFCSRCLATDEMPYFRRIWRVSFLTSCVEHGLLLRDRCPSCQAFIAPHRTDIFWIQQTNSRSTLYARCWSCSKLLSAGEQMEADPYTVLISSFVGAALAERFVSLNGEGIYAPAFFSGIRALASVCNAAKRKRAGFDSFPIDTRCQLLQTVGFWLSDWPAQFLESAEARGLTYSELRPSRDTLPFWIDSVAIPHFFAKRIHYSAEEIESVLAHLETSQGYGSPATARRIYGINIDYSRVPDELRPKAPSDAYQKLVTHIDESIKGCRSPSRRLMLQSDKVWICLGCVRGMSIRQLADLQLAELRILARGAWRSKRNAPQTIEEVRVLLRWYLARVRPQAVSNDNCTHAFLSRDGHRSVSPNGLSMRFRKHIVKAQLDGSVRNYSILMQSVK